MFTGVYIIFLIFAQNIDCGYSLEPTRRGGSNEYHNLCFVQKYEKYQKFLSFSFFGGKIFNIVEQACFRNVNFTDNMINKTTVGEDRFETKVKLL